MRLKKIFKSMKEGPHGKHCSGMEDLIKEGSELIAEGPDPAAAILAQKYKEEKETDKGLSQLAKAINVEAMETDEKDK
jgi:ferritin-like metal-binding protein YciE